MKEARAALGWTQRELSERLEEREVKLDASAITRLEKGQREPRLREAIEISEMLDFSLDLVAAADLNELGGEAQFARNETLMRRAMEAARRKIIEAFSCQHVAFDGILSDDEERAILARRGVSTPEEWMTWICDQMAFAFEREDEFGRPNFFMVTDPVHQKMLQTMTDTVTSNLFKTEEELFGFREAEKREYQASSIRRARETLEEALGGDEFRRRFGEAFKDDSPS